MKALRTTDPEPIPLLPAPSNVPDLTFTKNSDDARVHAELTRMNLLSLVKDVASSFLVPYGVILGRGRTKRVSAARQEVWARMYECGFSLPEIGFMFGRDHTTILYGIRTATKARKSAKLRARNAPLQDPLASAVRSGIQTAMRAN